MQRLDCTDIKALLSGLVDDELDEETRHLAERHLTGCAACREIVDEYETLDEMIALGTAREIEAARLSPQFERRVLEMTVHAGAVTPRRRHWPLWTGWFLAAAMLMLAMTIWIFQPVGPFTGSTETAAHDHRASDDEQAADQSSLDAAAHQPAVDTYRTVHRAVYTTGTDLRSQTFDGALPADSFRTASRSDDEAWQPILRTTRGMVDPAFTEIPGDGLRPRAVAQESSDLPVTGEPRDVVPDDEEASKPSDEAKADVPDMMRRARMSAELDRMAARRSISREDAETLYSASLVLGVLADAASDTFEDVERIRRVVEYEDLLPQLSEVRKRLAPKDQPLVMAAESVLLRVVQGPIDQNDLRELKATTARLDLPEAIERLSNYGA